MFSQFSLETYNLIIKHEKSWGKLNFQAESSKRFTLAPQTYANPITTKKKNR
jgi:hypothetical protein